MVKLRISAMWMEIKDCIIEMSYKKNWQDVQGLPERLYYVLLTLKFSYFLSKPSLDKLWRESRAEEQE